MTDPDILLREYQPVDLAPSRLEQSEAEEIYNLWKDRVTIDWPSPKTDGNWRLTAGGYVGTIPLSSGRLLRLEPKTPIGNIFRMLEYAYDVKIDPGDSLVDADTIEDLYSRLAGLLATRVMRRLRSGIYRSYVPREDHLPFVRGSMDIVRRATTPWVVKPYCRFQEHTPDILENQIIGWTLRTILRQGICTGRTLRSVRSAYRAVVGLVPLQPVTGSDCGRVFYHRLNSDYETLHALCRFFLDFAGPTHRARDRKMMPFLIDMAHLYETFVLKWLQRHTPDGIMFDGQYKVLLDAGAGFSMTMDIVMHRTGESIPLAILDTKYKVPRNGFANADVYQVQSYAAHQGAREAILVYPETPSQTLDNVWGASGIRVRTVVFRIDGDLDEVGRTFLGTVGTTSRIPDATT